MKLRQTDIIRARILELDAIRMFTSEAAWRANRNDMWQLSVLLGYLEPWE